MGQVDILNLFNMLVIRPVTLFSWTGHFQLSLPAPWSTDCRQTSLLDSTTSPKALQKTLPGWLEVFRSPGRNEPDPHKCRHRRIVTIIGLIIIAASCWLDFKFSYHNYDRHTILPPAKPAISG
jgi:hypothetical protein